MYKKTKPRSIMELLNKNLSEREVRQYLDAQETQSLKLKNSADSRA